MRDLVLDVSRLEALGDEEAVLQMDEDAFRVFYERTARQVWAYLARTSGSSQAADDLLQETFYRFLRAGRIFESDDHRRNYLFRIATNLVLDARRRAHVVFVEPPDEDDPGAAGTSVDEGERAARRADFTRAMSRLKPRDRSLLWLAYAHGASHAEIARSLGVKTSSIKALLSRARRRLAGFLKGDTRP